ncbi:MAG: VIT1/CCC1 transporter family protein [Candidatus Asgardarchaeia archaeon]
MSEKALELLKDFWEDEMIATELYKFLAKKASKEKVELFKKISEMEKAHAEIWSKIAEIKFSVKFKSSFSLKIKTFFMKLLAFIMPLTFMVYYLELDERSAVLNYSKLLEMFKKEPQEYSLVKRVIRDEIDHENQLVEMILGETSYISKAKDAIYGMTDSLVEILALVIGLAGFSANPLIIGLAGLISSIGGTFSMTSGAYLSTKSQNDIYEGKVREIDIKEVVSIESLKDSLVAGLKEKGVDTETAKHVVEIIGNNTNVLKNLVKSLSIEESYTNPKDAAVTTGVYYILGALPAIVPFFIPLIIPLTSVHAAIIAVIAAAIVSFFSGIFTAVLSGISIKKKSLENVIIIIGAAFATYLIGTLARMFLGVEI